MVTTVLFKRALGVALKFRVDAVEEMFRMIAIFLILESP